MLSELEQGIHAPPKFGGKPRKKFMDAYNRFFSDQPKDFIDKVADYLRGRKSWIGDCHAAVWSTTSTTNSR